MSEDLIVEGGIDMDKPAKEVLSEIKALLDVHMDADYMVVVFEDHLSSVGKHSFLVVSRYEDLNNEEQETTVVSH